MGELQEKGAPSSVNLNEKSSFLDFDVEEDFLSKWKVKSGVEDDIVDLDLDLDFMLDCDFGKLSFFNTDMSDLDVSSPLKEDGKHKEKPKEASASGSNKGKADNIDYSLDFNELDSFTFKSIPMQDKDASKDQDKGASPSRDDCQGSRIHLTEEIDVLEDGISEKPTASAFVSSSNANLKDGGRAHLDSMDGDFTLQSVRDDNGPSIPMTAIEKVSLQTEETSPQKPIPIVIQQTGCQPEKMSFAGPATQETFAINATLPETSVCSASGMDSSEDTKSELHDQVISMATEGNTSKGETAVYPSCINEQAKASTSSSHGDLKRLLPSMAAIQITSPIYPSRPLESTNYPAVWVCAESAGYSEIYSPAHGVVRTLFRELGRHYLVSHCPYSYWALFVEIGGREIHYYNGEDAIYLPELPMILKYPRGCFTSSPLEDNNLTIIIGVEEIEGEDRYEYHLLRHFGTGTWQVRVLRYEHVPFFRAPMKVGSRFLWFYNEFDTWHMQTLENMTSREYDYLTHTMGLPQLGGLETICPVLHQGSPFLFVFYEDGTTAVWRLVIYENEDDYDAVNLVYEELNGYNFYCSMDSTGFSLPPRPSEPDGQNYIFIAPFGGAEISKVNLPDEEADFESIKECYFEEPCRCTAAWLLIEEQEDEGGQHIGASEVHEQSPE